MPTAYLSKNNRLVQVDEHQGVLAGQLLLSTWYYYNAFGNVTYMVSGLPTGGGSQFMMGGGGGEEQSSAEQESTEQLEEGLGESEVSEGESEEPGEGGGSSMLLLFECATGDPYTAVRFEYAANGRTVTYALQEQWCWTGDPEDDPTEYQVNYVEHYRYDGARQRYLVQVLDPENPDPTDPQNVLDERWSDYDGNNVYGDFVIDNGNGVTVRSFEPGVALVTSIGSSGDAWTDYYHGDHLGSLLSSSDSGAATTSLGVFTAFGERRLGSVASAAERYGYVGAFGYQAHEAFSFLHVGHRYYDPASGRFLQRDPIGLRGGLNSYGYVGGAPTLLTDAAGLSVGGIVDFVGKVGGYVVPSPGPEMAGALECAPDAIRSYVEDSPRGHILRDHPENPQVDPNCPECGRLGGIVNPTPAPPWHPPMELAPPAMGPPAG